MNQQAAQRYLGYAVTLDTSNTKKWKSPFAERSCAPVISVKECHGSALRRSVQHWSELKFQFLINLASQGLTKDLILQWLEHPFAVNFHCCVLNFHLNGLANCLNHWSVPRKVNTGRRIWGEDDANAILFKIFCSPGQDFSGKQREHHQRPHENIFKIRRQTKEAFAVKKRAKPAAQLIATRYRRMCHGRGKISPFRMARTDILIAAELADASCAAVQL